MGDSKQDPVSRTMFEDFPIPGVTVDLISAAGTSRGRRVQFTLQRCSQCRALVPDTAEDTKEHSDWHHWLFVALTDALLPAVDEAAHQPDVRLRCAGCGASWWNNGDCECTCRDGDPRYEEWHELEGPPIGTRPEFSRRFVVAYTIAVVLIGVAGLVAITWAMWWS